MHKHGFWKDHNNFSCRLICLRRIADKSSNFFMVHSSNLGLYLQLVLFFQPCVLFQFFHLWLTSICFFCSIQFSFIFPTPLLLFQLLPIRYFLRSSVSLRRHVRFLLDIPWKHLTCNKVSRRVEAKILFSPERWPVIKGMLNLRETKVLVRWLRAEVISNWYVIFSHERFLHYSVALKLAHLSEGF